VACNTLNFDGAMTRDPKRRWKGRRGLAGVGRHSGVDGIEPTTIKTENYRHGNGLCPSASATVPKERTRSFSEPGRRHGRAEELSGSRANGHDLWINDSSVRDPGIFFRLFLSLSLICNDTCSDRYKRNATSLRPLTGTCVGLLLPVYNYSRAAT
jgi:hypothetical protein